MTRPITRPNGPCAGLGCGMRIVRYGPGASTLCETCTDALKRKPARAHVKETSDA